VVNVVTKIKEIVMRLHSTKNSALPDGVNRLESLREIRVARDARRDVAAGKAKKRAWDEEADSDVFNAVISAEYDAEFEEFKQFQRYKDQRRRAQVTPNCATACSDFEAPISSSASTAVFCIQCEVIRVDMKFCASCGFPLNY
jgi:hypothetical protein